MLFFKSLRWPFRTEDINDYPNVLVPLRARRCSEAAVATQVPSSLDPEHGEKDGTEVVGSDKSLYTTDDLRREISLDESVSEFPNTAYDLKARVINKAIQDIGMGRYNWELFALCGFGWFADNLWLTGISLILPSVSQEFGISEKEVKYTTASLYVGLVLGASFWGIGSDVVGRKLAFNSTLFLAGVFGLAAGAARTWIGLCALLAASTIGVGGNLPVDGALYLEFLPKDCGAMLTVLSAWWPLGQLTASLIAWGFLSDSYPFDKGWRYLVYTMAAIISVGFLCRFAVFHMFESPKYLISRGRQAEAVAVIHGMAYRNKTTTWLTEDILNEVGGTIGLSTAARLSTRKLVRKRLSRFSMKRIKPLFHTKRLGITTILLWFSWLTIGMAYPLFYAFLPQYLANGHYSSSHQTITHHETYRNYAISSVMGIPGSIVAGIAVGLPFVGRKGTMATATLGAGLFLFLFTTSTNSNHQLAFSALETFFANAMYAVLYAYTPEVFPAPNRGTGTGIASCLNRIAGLCAPVIAANLPGTNPNAPVYVSGVLVLAAFLAMCALPIETRGKQML